MASVMDDSYMIMYILSFLRMNDLMGISMVSKHWYTMTTNVLERKYRDICKKDPGPVFMPRFLTIAKLYLQQLPHFWRRWMLTGCLLEKEDITTRTINIAIKKTGGTFKWSSWWIDGFSMVTECYAKYGDFGFKLNFLHNGRDYNIRIKFGKSFHRKKNRQLRRLFYVPYDNSTPEFLLKTMAIGQLYRHNKEFAKLWSVAFIYTTFHTRKESNKLRKKRGKARARVLFLIEKQYQRILAKFGI